jgi:hypothetical protein
MRRKRRPWELRRGGLGRSSGRISLPASAGVPLARGVHVRRHARPAVRTRARQAEVQGPQVAGAPEFFPASRSRAHTAERAASAPGGGSVQYGSSRVTFRVCRYRPEAAANRGSKSTSLCCGRTRTRRRCCVCGARGGLSSDTISGPRRAPALRQLRERGRRRRDDCRSSGAGASRLAAVLSLPGDRTRGTPGRDPGPGRSRMFGCDRVSVALAAADLREGCKSRRSASAGRGCMARLASTSRCRLPAGAVGDRYWRSKGDRCLPADLPTGRGTRAQAEEYRKLDGERSRVFHDTYGHGNTSRTGRGPFATKGPAPFQVRGSKLSRLVGYFTRQRALADLGLPPATGPPRTRRRRCRVARGAGVSADVRRSRHGRRARASEVRAQTPVRPGKAVVSTPFTGTPEPRPSRKTRSRPSRARSRSDPVVRRSRFTSPRRRGSGGVGARRRRRQRPRARRRRSGLRRG